MNNKIKNLLIFTYLMHTIREDNIRPDITKIKSGLNPVMDDYFQEKMELLIGTIKNKDGVLYTYDMWESNFNDEKQFALFDFMRSFNFDEISDEEKIKKYDDKYTIVGVHQIVTNRLVNKVIPNFFKSHKKDIREFKLNIMLED